MRYPPEHKEATRRTILMAAAKMFRQNGYQCSGIDAVMAEAGLTVGGFYAHFKNKEDLLCQMLKELPELIFANIPEQFAKLEGKQWLEAYIEYYLSEEHVADPKNSCPIPSLISEVERRDQLCRDAYAGMHNFMTGLTASNLAHLPQETRGPTASALSSLIMGAASSARAMIGTENFKTVLSSARNAAHALIRNGIAEPELA